MNTVHSTYGPVWKLINGYYFDDHTLMSDEDVSRMDRIRIQHDKSLPRYTTRQWRKIMGMKTLRDTSHGRLDSEDIKDRTDMRDLVGRYVQRTPRQGQRDNLMFPCPFHSDTNASLSVSIDKKLWHCFAGCGSGDSIAFVMQAEECDFKTALSLLNQWY